MSRAWPVKDVDPALAVKENSRRVLAVRIAELYSYEPVIDHPEWSEPLHNMRIAAKRLRYSLELFEPQFGAVGKKQIERIKAIQEALGDLHDHDVRIDMVGSELSAASEEHGHRTRADIAAAEADQLEAIVAAALRPPPDDPRRGLIALLGREHARRRSAYQRFRDLWEEFAAEGMRADLVSLSMTPIAEVR